MGRRKSNKRKCQECKKKSKRRTKIFKKFRKKNIRKKKQKWKKRIKKRKKVKKWKKTTKRKKMKKNRRKERTSFQPRVSRPGNSWLLIIIVSTKRSLTSKQFVKHSSYIYLKNLLIFKIHKTIVLIKLTITACKRESLLNTQL